MGLVAAAYLLGLGWGSDSLGGGQGGRQEQGQRHAHPRHSDNCIVVSALGCDLYHRACPLPDLVKYVLMISIGLRNARGTGTSIAGLLRTMIAFSLNWATINQPVP